jgi:hypothetical protein
MPGFNGAGPWGRGPGTGWGLGPCGAGQRRGLGGLGGRGFGRGGFAGRGRGRGFGGRPQWGSGSGGFGPYGPERRFPAAAPQDEAAALKEEEAYLRGELEAIQKRLAQLEGSP